MCQDFGWESSNVADLAKLFSDTLHTCFHSAIRKLSENGHSAEETVLKCGPFYGIKDMVSCIVDRVLDYLKMKRCHTWYTFNDLNSLVEYMMLEMVTMLTYVKPSLSVHEALWTLLICDLNVFVASEAEIDPHNFWIGGLKTSSQPQTQSQSQHQQTTASTDSKHSRLDEKCQCCKRWQGKSLCYERPLKGQMSKKALKEKIALLGTLCLDQKQSPLVHKNSASLKEKPKTETPKPDYYLALAGIPYDESKGEHVPRDDQDKMILTAVGQLESLQKEVKSWDDWATVKVMQVAKRLSQDRAEMKKLKEDKLEAENSKIDKEALLEENAKKKQSELTAALATTDCQFQMSSSTIARLELENSTLKRDKERAEKLSVIEAKHLEEALCKELEALKKWELCGSEKNLLEEDLKSLRREVGQKKRDLEKAKQLLKETETRLAQEERMAAKFHEQAESIRNERERLEALAEAGDERARRRAGKELKKIETEIKRIQYEIAAFNLKEETKKNAAAITGMSWQLSEGASQSMVSRKYCTHDYECAMCLTEEMTVLFIPCGHQVLCADCNVIHEDKGMKDCPSCRSPIQKRINCLFAKSKS